MAFLAEPVAAVPIEVRTELNTLVTIVKRVESAVRTPLNRRQKGAR